MCLPQWLSRCGPQDLFRSLIHQNYFHNNAKLLFAFFILIFSQCSIEFFRGYMMCDIGIDLMQKQVWTQLLKVFEKKCKIMPLFSLTSVLENIVIIHKMLFILTCNGLIIVIFKKYSFIWLCRVLVAACRIFFSCSMWNLLVAACWLLVVARGV